MLLAPLGIPRGVTQSADVLPCLLGAMRARVSRGLLKTMYINPVGYPLFFSQIEQQNSGTPCH